MSHYNVILDESDDEQEHDLQHVVELDRLVYQSEHDLFDASV